MKSAIDITCIFPSAAEGNGLEGQDSTAAKGGES